MSYKKDGKCHCDATLLTVIIGSFRKHLGEIIKLKQQLEDRHVAVLSPIDEDVVNPNDEFIIFNSDPVSDPKLLQDSVFAKIKRSTFVIVANIDGYLGRAAILEIGYALALGISIYTLEPVEDPHLVPYCRLLSSIFPDIEIDTTSDQDLQFAISEMTN